MTDYVNEQTEGCMCHTMYLKGQDPEIEGRHMNTAKNVTFFHALTKKGVKKDAFEP